MPPFLRSNSHRGIRMNGRRLPTKEYLGRVPFPSTPTPTHKSPKLSGSNFSLRQIYRGQKDDEKEYLIAILRSTVNDESIIPIIVQTSHSFLPPYHCSFGTLRGGASASVPRQFAVTQCSHSSKVMRTRSPDKRKVHSSPLR